RELGLIAAQLDGLWHLTKRTITESERTGVPGIGGSIFKLYYSEVRHHLGDLAMKILGTAALATEDEPAVDHVRGWIHAMSISIAAGTTQIQRNILSERVLGMPAAVIVFEQLGRALVPGPLVGTHLARTLGIPGERVTFAHRDDLVISNLDSSDAVAVIDAEGVWVISQNGIAGVPVAQPLDPLTPVSRVSSLPQGERVVEGAD